MKGAVILGDSTTHGGKVITANSHFTIDGTKVALVGDLVSCPIVGHGITPILEGSQSFTDKGVSIAIDGAVCGCGCKLIASSKRIQSKG